MPFPSLWYVGSSLRLLFLPPGATDGVLPQESRLRSLDLLRLRRSLAADWSLVDSLLSIGLDCLEGDGEEEEIEEFVASLKMKEKWKTKISQKQTQRVLFLSN